MNKITKNFIYNAIYQILILLIPLITTPYVARNLGAEGVGIYSYTYSIVYYFMMFALLGMNNYGNREISKLSNDREKRNNVFSEIYYLQCFITIIIIGLYTVFIFFADKEYFIFFLINSLYIISVIFDINWFFCGLQEFKLTIIRSGIIKICTFIAILFFVRNINDLWKYIFILAFSTLFNQMILWPFLRGKVSFVKVKINNIFRHLKPTLILFIPIIAISIFRIMDKIMIGAIINVTEVGYYENSEKMLNILLSVIGALGTVTLPQMTYLYSQNKLDEYNQILKNSLQLTLFITFPTICGFLVIADDLITVYLGNNFFKSIILLKILSISLLFTPIANIIRMQILIPREKDKEYIVSVSLGAIANLFLNILLINKWNSIGASIATIIAEFIVFFVEIIYTYRYIDYKSIFKGVYKFFISSILMLICLFIIGKFINNMILRMIIQILSGIAIYFILNYSFIKDALKMLKNKN